MGEMVVFVLVKTTMVLELSPVLSSVASRLAMQSSRAAMCA
jgi:hypothetical protein